MPTFAFLVGIKLSNLYLLHIGLILSKESNLINRVEFTERLHAEGGSDECVAMLSLRFVK